MAMACLATTLAMAKDAVDNVPMEERLCILRDVCNRLGISTKEDDEGEGELLLRPLDEEVDAAYTQSMEFLSRLVGELQEMAEA